MQKPNPHLSQKNLRGRGLRVPPFKGEGDLGIGSDTGTWSSLSKYDKLVLDMMLLMMEVVLLMMF